MSDAVRTVCCKTALRWPGEGEEMACSCGALTWRRDGDRLEIAGPLTAHPRELVEQIGVPNAGRKTT